MKTFIAFTVYSVHGVVTIPVWWAHDNLQQLIALPLWYANNLLMFLVFVKLGWWEEPRT